MNLRYESQANRGFPDDCARDSATSGVIPTFNTVSIMPGIENFAPDRTETNSGFDTPPNCLPKSFSSCTKAVEISAFNASVNIPSFKY